MSLFIDISASLSASTSISMSASASLSAGASAFLFGDAGISPFASGISVPLFLFTPFYILRLTFIISKLLFPLAYYLLSSVIIAIIT